MGYYSDPTAAKALGEINKEFSRLERKAKKLRKLLKEGRLSAESLENAQSQFKGIYRHVLNNVLEQQEEQN